MVWTQATYDALVTKTKSMVVDLGVLLVRDCTLGQDTTINLDLLEYSMNILNGLKYGVLIYQDEHYDYLNEQVDIIYGKCRKYLTV